jgi:periplasmic divalent cation tolerance protein
MQLMGSEMNPVLIYTTWPDVDAATAVGRELVAKKLAACVNVLSPATSIYMWDGATACDTEHPMLIKTVAGRSQTVMAMVRRLHPYDVPAIAVLDITGGDPAFLSWIGAQTRMLEVDGDEQQ